MSDYILYASPNTYAMSAHAILEEINADYEVEWIEIFTLNPDINFQKISPHCRTPALMTPDGGIFETGAIAMYLGEKFPKFNLIIDPDDPRRGKFLQWFYYLGSTLQPDVMIQFHPEFYISNEKDIPAFQKASRERLSHVLNVLDQALENGPFFFGEQITILDFLLSMQTIWKEIFPSNISDFKNLKRNLDVIQEKPAVKQILKYHLQSR